MMLGRICVTIPVPENGAEIKGIRMTFSDDLTNGVEDIEAIKKTDRQNDDRWYRLNGTVVEKPLHGIYIHNGKRVVVGQRQAW